MIMGGGKTTVIAPLLALGDRLVVQCVPAALLEMSRGDARRLSTVVIRGVHAPLRPALDRRPHGAAARQGATRGDRRVPAESIKAFLLKLVQCFHLSLSRSADDAESVGSAIASAFGNLTRGLKRAIGGHDAHAEQAALRAGRALRRGVPTLPVVGALLDEVDLCLHPLKAELNWPLGDKLALDFTQGERQGLRWRILFPSTASSTSSPARPPSAPPRAPAVLTPASTRTRARATLRRCARRCAAASRRRLSSPRASRSCSPSRGTAPSSRRSSPTGSSSSSSSCGSRRRRAASPTRR